MKALRLSTKVTFQADILIWIVSFPLRFVIRVQVNLILVSDVFFFKIHDQNLPLKHCCTLGFILDKQ